MIKLEMRRPRTVMVGLAGCKLLRTQLAAVYGQQPRLWLALEMLAKLHHHNPGVGFFD